MTKPQRIPGMKIIGSFKGKIKNIAELPNGKRLIATDLLEFYMWNNDKLVKVEPCNDARQFKKYLNETRRDTKRAEEA